MVKNINQEIRQLLSERGEYELDLVSWVTDKMKEAGIREDYIERFLSHPHIVAARNIKTDGQRLVIAQLLSMELVAYSLEDGNTLNERYLLMTDQTLEGWMVSMMRAVLPALKKLTDNFGD